MTSKERQYIEWLIDRNDSLRHETAVNYLFYGKASVTTTIKRVVAMFFSDRKYAFVRKEIYPTFVGVFYQRLIVINPNSLRGIDNLAAYFYRTTKDFLLEEDIRKKIDISLGIDYTHVELVVEKQPSDAEPEDREEASSQVVNEEQIDNIEIEDQDSECEDSKEDNENDWVGFFLNPYIQRLMEGLKKGDERERLILALQSYIMGEPTKVYASRVGITPADADVRRRRAHVELLKVALPDIFKLCRTMFVRFGSQLDSSKRDLLNEFFITGDYGIGKKTTSIAEALKTLIKKANSVHNVERQRVEKEQKRFEDKETKAKVKEKKNSII